MGDLERLRLVLSDTYFLTADPGAPQDSRSVENLPALFELGTDDAATPFDIDGLDVEASLDDAGVDDRRESGGSLVDLDTVLASMILVLAMLTATRNQESTRTRTARVPSRAPQPKTPAPMQTALPRSQPAAVAPV